MAGIEYLTTANVCEIMGVKPKTARKIMKEVGLIAIGNGMIRRDALDRYIALRTTVTAYTRPLLEIPIKPNYPRYARNRKEA